MNTLDILNIIGNENKEIEAFSFHTFPSQKLIQEQLPEWGDIEQKHFERAMEVRDKLRLPFWDAIMVTAFNNPNYSLSILNAALRHNHARSLFQVRTEDILYNPLLSNNSERIAVCSSVLMKDKRTRHIPMLDFHIPVSELNLSIVEDVCKILKLGPGYILNSGESYHFISSGTVSWADLYLILSKALRFCPILDRAWISRQLEEGFCSLRVDRKNNVETVLEKSVR